MRRVLSLLLTCCLWHTSAFAQMLMPITNNKLTSGGPVYTPPTLNLSPALSTWTVSGSATITVTATTAPDGSTFYYTASPTTTSSGAGTAGSNQPVSGFITVSNSTNYVVGVYWNNTGTAPNVWLQASDASANAAGVTFNTSTCAYTGSGNNQIAGVATVVSASGAIATGSICFGYMVVSSSTWVSGHFKFGAQAASSVTGGITSGQTVNFADPDVEAGSSPTTSYH